MAATTTIQKIRGVTEGFLIGAFASVCGSAAGGTIVNFLTSSNVAYIEGMTAGAIGVAGVGAMIHATNGFNQRSFGGAVIAGGLAIAAAIPFVMPHLLR
jgi:hypothetical protein